MATLPVIVGAGGINAAGRSSGFHSYKRMIHEALSPSECENTWRDLAYRMGLGHELTPDVINTIKAGTLIRKIDSFDPNNITYHHKATINSESDISFTLKKYKLPDPIPETWKIETLENNNEVKVTIAAPASLLLPGTIRLPVTSGANIPKGFDPGTLYNSKHHPRGLKLAVYGASDMLNSLGFEWEEILNHIKPDEIAVYAGSALAQVDECSLAGLFYQPLSGNRITSKMMALSLPEMAADFINSYIINSVGTTGTNIGACASFLYNLRQGISDIQTGKAKVVIVGNTEAPLVPEILEGFRVMGALAEDDQLRKLDNSDHVDHRRACRPFSTNTGFTMAESAQFIVLMDDDLALKLGASIYGSVPDVFINADANKRSIASPGIGNYITVAKTAALAKTLLGQDGLERTFIQAHGTGTPQNRVSESHIFNEVAKLFSIKKWNMTAIKSYIGHSISVAAGDQLITSLGVWEYGWIPGIKTIDHIADDVEQSNLNILTDHHFVGEKGNTMDGTIINSKGFGGNNASCLVISPHKTLQMLEKKHGATVIGEYKKRNIPIRDKSKALDLKTCQGEERIVYKFAESVMDETSISLSQTKVQLSEFSKAIDLPTDSPYKKYC